MKTIKQLCKADKIALLEAIKSGEIKPYEITTETIVVSDGKEAFLGLMIASTSQNEGNESNVVFIGEAKEQLEIIVGNNSE
jgi:hypothetical protein